MNNINEILRRASKLLWHLDSYRNEQGGAERFESELLEYKLPVVSLESMINAVLEPPRTYSPKFVRHGAHLSFRNGERRDTECITIAETHLERSQRAVRETFYQTNIGISVWETLDYCLEERRPCFIEGLEGRGKSASGKAWFEAHRSEARYASLPGLSTQRDFFTALAQAYGVPFGAAKAPNEIRFRIRDVIVRSGLVLIIDEAHFALPERSQRGRPALIDWIDTELCNNGVAVALISTPQFGPRLAEFENSTTWNARQFRRRFSGRWCQLDKETTREHLAALTKTVLPGVGEKGINIAVEFAAGMGRDVSGLFDLVRDAQRRARKAGRPAVTFQDLRDAYQLDRRPVENAIAESFAGKSRTVLEQEPEDDAVPLQRGRIDNDPEPTNRVRGLMKELNS